MEDDNPYSAPANQDFSITGTDVANEQHGGALTLLASYAGTVVSGGMFGLIGGVIGVAVGIALACTVGAGVYLTLGALSRLFQSKVAMRLFCGLLGALTGYLSLILPFCLNGDTSNFTQWINNILFAILPAGIGSVGAFVGALASEIRGIGRRP